MLDRKASDEAEKRFNDIAKPQGSLGKFENIIIKIAGMTGTADVDISRRAVAVFCASNGIVDMGVSSSGNEVTRIVSDNVNRGRSSINSMAAAEKADVFMIDMGIDVPTGNFAVRPAMTEAEAMAAIEKGKAWAHRLNEEGYKIIVSGEVGMGNTTTAAAVICALLSLDPKDMVGSGAGLDQEHVELKKKLIADAISGYGLYNADPVRVLSCVGGFDICGMAGLFLGGMECHIPVLIDGVISSCAALAASFIDPECTDYMIPSHLSREPAALSAMEHLHMDPVLHADMALGEGTGAVLMLGLLDAVLAAYYNTATYADLGLV